MSMLGSKFNSENKGSSSFHEFRKQASFFLKEKIKTARLALTDVTPAQLLVEESTSENQWAPDTRTLKIISKAAFEVDDYWRIVDILHKRFVKFDRGNWRTSYNSLVVLEHLLTQGPESVAEEFQGDKDVIKEMESFQHIDEKGFNWGLNVRKKSEKIAKLLGDAGLLKEERERSRKLSRGIEGFGSFISRASSPSSSSPSTRAILRESSSVMCKRSNSQFSDHINVESPQDQLSNMARPWIKPQLHAHDDAFHPKGSEQVLDDPGSKENTAPESKPLLGIGEKGSQVIISIEEDHPFNDDGKLSKVSLLVSNDS